MSEHAPTTGQIRTGYIDDGGMAEYYDPINGHRQAKASGIEFDRWLAEHDAEVAAKALFDIGLTSGSALIAKERRRQIEGEGYDTDADAGRAHALVDAAVCYAHAGRYREGKIPMSWPWAPRFWKPTGDPVRNLVKAGALIAAAIDSVRSTKVTEGATT